MNIFTQIINSVCKMPFGSSNSINKFLLARNFSKNVVDSTKKINIDWTSQIVSLFWCFNNSKIYSIVLTHCHVHHDRMCVDHSKWMPNIECKLFANRCYQHTVEIIMKKRDKFEFNQFVNLGDIFQRKMFNFYFNFDW